MDSQKKLFSCKEALFFRNEFREARATALKDAEGYQQILFVLERLGSYLFERGCCEKHEHSEESKGLDAYFERGCCEKHEHSEESKGLDAYFERGCCEKHKHSEESKGLDAYKECLIALVKKYHPLEKHRKRKNKPKWTSLYRDSHTAFGSLYEMVMHGRNDALHQGAFVRILTLHLVEVALFLEDTLMAITGGRIKDYMVRNPVCAYAWQPVSFVRQMMLANSFSYIPVYMKKKETKEKAWHIIADYHIAEYLRSAGSDGRGKLLAKSIEKAIADEMTIEEAVIFFPGDPIQKVLERIKGEPILVVKSDNCDELLGIATAFDLM